MTDGVYQIWTAVAKAVSPSIEQTSSHPGLHPPRQLDRFLAAAGVMYHFLSQSLLSKTCGSNG